ncbi:Zn-dependent exopeptidase M28 [Luteimonas aestuarii]|uniref:Zn-dependent exopeptidase M28 n=1 Tax=Luteimonas aestuarii TaxID=453837 RepID=A0A4R5TRM7_9GAMM|nr:M28 family peptidase [Luteimonas aestuarii]TDK23713.1 Zn-dependent exopeptidase M28 [Luteimonas aestuarii]
MSLSRRPFAILLLALLLSACASHAPDSATAPPPAAAPTAAGSAWLDDVAAIAANRGSDARRGAILSRLDAAGLASAETAFTARDLAGMNLLATVSGGSGQPLLLLGAHYDQVDVGSGVTDNASGSAVVLSLARRLQQDPLQHHRVAVAFWDLEEKGLLGANAYVAEGGERPALYVNFDVFGWGDTVWMMSPDSGHPLATATRRAADTLGLHASIGERYPPTDHLAFLKAGWPAVSYSLVGKHEIPSILEMFTGKTPRAMPKVMQVIHSERDTLAEVDPAAVETAIDAIEAALREWDAGAG